MGDDETSRAAPPADWAARLLAFWFDDHGFDDWYGGGPEFDAAVEALAGAVGYSATLSFIRGQVDTLTRAMKGE